MELEKRFWRKVKKTEGCWEWQGASQTQGCGVIHVNGKSKLAYRVSYEMAYGPIPEGLCVLHSCDNQACVRPDHLSLGSRADNNKDRARKGRTVAGRRYLSLEDRLMLNIEYQQGSECWLWKGSQGRQGYGQMRFEGKTLMPHRVSYELFVEPIPDGMILMHTCDVSRCVNPDHLKVGTRAENMADMHGKGRHAHGERHGNVGYIEFSDPEARRANIKAALNRPGTRARLTEHLKTTWAKRSATERAEIGRKVALAQKGKSFSPEHLTNLRAAHAARRGTERSIPWNKGVACSDETKRKISESKRRK